MAWIATNPMSVCTVLYDSWILRKVFVCVCIVGKQDINKGICCTNSCTFDPKVLDFRRKYHPSKLHLLIEGYSLPSQVMWHLCYFEDTIECKNKCELALDCSLYPIRIVLSWDSLMNTHSSRGWVNNGGYCRRAQFLFYTPATKFGAILESACPSTHLWTWYISFSIVS